jgi:hypothetical protein
MIAQEFHNLLGGNNFSPDVYNPVHWFDFSKDGDTLTASNTIFTAKNYGSSGVDLSNNIPSKDRIRKESYLGKNWAFFDGSNTGSGSDILSLYSNTTTGFDATEGTHFMAHRSTSYGGSFQFYTLQSGPSGNLTQLVNNDISLVDSFYSVTRLSGVLIGKSIVEITAFNGMGSFPYDFPVITSHTYNATASIDTKMTGQYSVSLTQSYTGIASTPTHNINLGRTQERNGAQVYIGEYLYFDYIMTTEQQSMIIDYLVNKWS